MNYLNELPKVIYTLEGDTQRLATNLFVSIRRRSYRSIDDYLLFERYDVGDGDTPEIVADRVYGHTQYWWVVALVADIIKADDWPVSDEELEKRMDRKLGPNGRRAGTWVDDRGRPRAYRVRRSFTDLSSGDVVTWHDNGDGLGVQRHDVVIARGTFLENQDKVRTENLQKRQIVVLSPAYLSDFVADFKKQLTSRSTAA